MSLRGPLSRPAVKIVIVGYAREVLDRKSLELPLTDKMTMRDLFTELSKFGRPGFREAIFDPETGKMNEYLAVFINSREIRPLGGLEARLGPGDTVTIMPPMAGGLGSG